MGCRNYCLCVSPPLSDRHIFHTNTTLLPAGSITLGSGSTVASGGGSVCVWGAGVAGGLIRHRECGSVPGARRLVEARHAILGPEVQVGPASCQRLDDPRCIDVQVSGKG